MVARKLLAAVVVGLSIHSNEALHVRNAVNPIRRVVNLLQDMAKKVAEEGAAEKALYERFACYCKTSGGDLKQNIEEGGTSITETAANIEAAQGSIAQLKSQLTQSVASRADAEAAVKTAGALNKKAVEAFQGESTDLSANIDALTRAIAALEKGMTGASFLQGGIGAAVRRAVMNSEKVSDVDRSSVLSFLSGGSSDGDRYAPQSGEIVGILKQLKDEMSADLSAAEKEEEQRKVDHQGLMKAKSQEMSVLTQAIEKHQVQMGNLGVEVEKMKGDLSEAQKTLQADQDLAAKLSSSCSVQGSEWEERQKVRAEELVAIHETIKLLNDDDSLELFKETLTSPTLLQLQNNRKAIALRARALVNGPPRGSSHLNLISMALSGKSVDFTKVIGMIDEMVVLLQEEQVDDDSKKTYCVDSIDKTEDEGKSLSNDIENHQSALSDFNDQLSATGERLEAVAKSISELDASVAKATTIRQDEHAEFLTVTANNAATSQLLGIAVNRLNKFYNPKLYKAPAKVELKSEDRVYVNLGGSITTAAPTGIAGTDVSRVQLLQEPVAEPFTSKFEKKHEEATGVVALIHKLIAEVEKDSQEAKVDEANAQEQYENFTADSSANRAGKVKETAALQDTRATLQSSVTATTGELQSSHSAAAAASKVLASLHQECDWLLQNFDARQEARAGEKDALNNAKAVLAGSDYSL